MPKRDHKALAPWRVLAVEESLHTPWFSIRKYSCELTPDHVLRDYYVHEGPDSVMCACMTEEGLIVLERQYRFPLRAVSMDYPAGSVEPGDKDLEHAALRELEEETGFIADRVKHLFSLSKDPSFSTGNMHVFLATGARSSGKGPDPTERVVVDLLRPEEVMEAVRTGKISCAFCVATTLWLAQLFNWKSG